MHREIAVETELGDTAASRADRLANLEAEMANFRAMMEFVHHIPDEVSLTNIDASGQTFPLHGILGGDHIIFVDFARRHNLDARIERALRAGQKGVAERLRMCKDRVGILVADSSGQDMTDALLTAIAQGITADNAIRVDY